jgi:hypothetical protein
MSNILDVNPARAVRRSACVDPAAQQVARRTTCLLDYSQRPSTVRVLAQMRRCVQIHRGQPGSVGRCARSARWESATARGGASGSPEKGEM